MTATCSPHVQLHVAADNGPITCVGVTDQRWERPFVHGGNIYPSAARHVDSMLDWAGRLACWLQNEGYTGMLGLDFVEYADPVTGELKAMLAEVHPRVDGATYPLAILQRLNATQREWGRPQSAAFVSGTLDLHPTGFAAFRRAAERFLYSKATGTGMVPYEVELPGRGPLLRGRSRSVERRGPAALRRAPDVVPAGALNAHR